MVNKKKLSMSTTLVEAGRSLDARNFYSVSTPTYHASTVIYPNLEACTKGIFVGDHWTNYARIGTPTTFALEEALCEIQGAERAFLTPSGLSAIAMALLSFAQAGDHILVTDNLYAPARHFLETILKPRGVEVTYYDPLDLQGFGSLIRKETRAVYMEQPGSLTFEVQDIPAFTRIAKQHNLVTMLDNTWSGAILYPAFDYGVDVVIHSLTKFFSGHADILMGAVLLRDTLLAENVSQTHKAFGMCVDGDGAERVLRGLRTLELRLKRHQESGLNFAQWASQQPQVEKVLYPALPSHPEHHIWARDFKGANGLMSVVLKPHSHKALAAMVDHYDIFKLGLSWGGFESLVHPFIVGGDPANSVPARVTRPLKFDGTLLRIYIGLEDVEDLKADFKASLERLSAKH